MTRRKPNKGDFDLGKETELKLLIDPVSLSKLTRHPLIETLKDGPERSEMLVSTYFDTPDGHLMNNHAALRVRRIGGRFVQTIKTAPAPDDSWTRGEWEAEVKDETPDLSLIDDVSLSALFAPGIAERLTPLFCTKIERTSFLLKTPDAEIELALDQGTIRAETGETNIAEIELELKSGAPLTLFRMARELGADTPLRLSLKSKAERGYQLALGLPSEPVKAKDVDLDPALSTRDAFQRIARSCLEQIIGNLDCLDSAPSSEAIHQLRVGVRRLRTVLSIFKPEQPDAEGKAIRAELGWLQGALTEARESAVFIHDFLDPILPMMGEDPGFSGLYADFDAKKQKSGDEARGILDLARLSLLLLRSASWIESGAWFANANETTSADFPATVGRFAESVIKKRIRQVQKALPGLAKQSVEARHESRIAVKKLRYALEFFASIRPRNKQTKKARMLTRLQDQLGLLNDIAQGGERLKDYAETCGDDHRIWAAGMVIGWNLARADIVTDQASQSAKACLKILKR